MGEAFPASSFLLLASLCPDPALLPPADTFTMSDTFAVAPKVQQREVAKDSEDIQLPLDVNGNGLCFAWGPLENVALVRLEPRSASQSNLVPKSQCC